MGNSIGKFSVVLTLLSLIVSVFSATVIWVAVPRESAITSFFMIERGAWVLTHVVSSVSLVSGILFLIAANWAKLKSVILSKSKPKSKNDIPQEVRT
jgi:hypothetical protein